MTGLFIGMTMPPFPDKFASAQIYYFTFIHFWNCMVFFFQIIVLHVALNFAHHQVLYSLLLTPETQIMSSNTMIAIFYWI